MKIVDAHCHVGVGARKKQTIEQLLEQMDLNEIDMAVICPVEEQIIIFNKQGNDHMIECQKSFPDRIIGFAVSNPWYGEEGIAELKRALDSGLRGIKFNTSIQGLFINDRIIYPFIEVAKEYAVPVYFHSGTPIYALPFQLKELAENFKAVDFIMGHCGYADSWTDIIPVCKDCNNIYVETSHLTSLSADAPEFTVFGPERVLFGSDSPMLPLELELFKHNNVNLSDHDRSLVMGGNILRLLKQ